MGGLFTSLPHRSLHNSSKRKVSLSPLQKRKLRLRDFPRSYGEGEEETEEEGEEGIVTV